MHSDKRSISVLLRNKLEETRYGLYAFVRYFKYSIKMPLSSKVYDVLTELVVMSVALGIYSLILYIIKVKLLSLI